MTRRFFKYISQNILAMMGMSFYVLVDAICISKYAGSDGLVGLNLALPLFGIMEGIGAMLGTGFATVYALDKASGNDHSFHFMQAMFWCLVLGLPISALGIFCPQAVMRALGAEGYLVQFSAGYAGILMSMAPMFMFNFVMSAFARNDNATAVSMAATLTGSIMNVILDYLFMFVFDWGFRSAALASVISPTLSVIILSFHFLGKRNKVPRKLSRPRFRLLVKSCSLGVSSFMSHISAGLIIFVFNRLILGISGTLGVAAYSIIANIAYIPMAIHGGIADGAQPLLSECCGKDDKKGTAHIFRLGMASVSVVSVLIVLCCEIFADPIVSIFNEENNAHLALLARNCVRLYSLAFLVSGPNLMLISYFASTDRALPEIIGSLSRGCVTIVACAIIMARLWALNGIWLSCPVAEAITLILMLIMLLVQNAKERRIEK